MLVSGSVSIHPTVLATDLGLERENSLDLRKRGMEGLVRSLPKCSSDQRAWTSLGISDGQWTSFEHTCCTGA